MDFKDKKNDDILEKLVHINRIAKVVKGGRRFGFSALVVVGNQAGKIGIAHAKAKQVPDAIKKANETARRNLIHQGLNDLPGVECSLPGGAFYAFPKVIGTGMNGAEFCKKAMHEAGVAIVPGTAFGKTCNDYVRFSFAASRDNISQALENIKKMLTK